jgi:hypothetical protein
MVVGQFKRNES